MRPSLRAALGLLLFLLCGVCIGACNTAKGAAEDLRQAGEATEHAINELTR